jgi:pseudolysin
MQITLGKLAVTGMLFIFMTTVSAAATRVDLDLKQSSNLQASSAVPTEFKEISRSVDMNQTTHIRVQETYAGYRVWGGEAVLHTKQYIPTVKSMVLTQTTHAYTSNGILFKGLDADLAKTPAYIFTSAQADKAYAQILKKTYASSVTQPQKELIVYVDDNLKAHWAFLISYVVTSKQLAKPTYIIDAENFSIYENWDDVKTFEVVNAGGFGGNIKTGRVSYDSIGVDLPALKMRRNSIDNRCYIQNDDVIVKDVRSGDQVVQFNCVNEDKNHHEYWDEDLDATNGAYSPSNDALYAGKQIRAMYQDWYHIPVLLNRDGTPMRMVMRVHEMIENAYWYESVMTFGDGGTRFYPLVSLGVAAHEISHGFTEQHSNLIYLRQSGGLNEAFSDMAAQAVEFYAFNHNTWQIGSEILKDKKSLRYLDEPTKDCEDHKPGDPCSISNAKDYKSDLNVHFTSGVFNKLFYLLSTSKDWDVHKAFDVMVQANMNYWTPSVGFVNAACGMISAAKALGYDTEAIKSAALGVGINTINCAQL